LLFFFALDLRSLFGFALGSATSDFRALAPNDATAFATAGTPTGRRATTTLGGAGSRSRPTADCCSHALCFVLSQGTHVVFDLDAEATNDLLQGLVVLVEFFRELVNANLRHT
jgi:hypothetical protein